MEKWEIEHDNNPHYYCQRLVKMITGLSIDEVIDVQDKNSGWYTRDFKNAFRALGFNCSDRFVKFDRDTPTPCIMRSTRRIKKKLYWYASVYYDGWVYIPGLGIHDINEYNQIWPHDKITSMLRVWI